MSIVIDVNTLTKVFNENDNDHNEFLPVKNWIESKKGKIVIGGSSYKEELGKMGRYLSLIRIYSKKKMVIYIDDEAVDEREGFLEEKLGGTDCDDPHIIALLGVSRCQLLSSVDERSFRFIKDSSNYPKDSPKVKIYTGSRNVDLLCEKNISRLSKIA